MVPALSANPRLTPFSRSGQDVIAKYPDNYTKYEQNLKKWDEGGSKGPRPGRPMGPGNPHEPTTLFTTAWWLPW